MNKESLNQFPLIPLNSFKQPVQQELTQKQQLPSEKNRKIRGPPKGSKRKPNLAVGIKTGLWTLNEMKGYLKFISRFKSHFKDKVTRKKKKIFHRMANFVKSRTAQQCRSHHQKLQLKLNSHQEIINFIKNEIQIKLQQAKQRLIAFKNSKNVCIASDAVIKTQNNQVPLKEKQVQKKTDLKDQDSFYEITETRQGLLITISAQNMQIW